MKRKKYRPGPGWKFLGSGVWEHMPSGTRISIIGLIRKRDKTFMSLSVYPEGFEGDKFIKINGNRKRGLMAWAISLIKD